MPTSNYGLIQGLSVDLSPIARNIENQRIRAEAAAQKKQQEEATRLQKTMDKFNVASGAIAIPYFQNVAKEKAAKMWTDIEEKYSKDKNYINSIEYNQKIASTLAEIGAIKKSDDNLVREQNLVTFKQDDYEMDEGLKNALLSSNPKEMESWLTAHGGSPTSYTPGFGVKQKYNPKATSERIYTGVSTTKLPEKQEVIPLQGGTKLLNTYTVEKYDENQLTKNFMLEWDSNIAMRAHYKNDVKAAYESFEKEKKNFSGSKFIPTGGAGNTYSNTYNPTKQWKPTYKADGTVQIDQVAKGAYGMITDPTTGSDIPYNKIIIDEKAGTAIVHVPARNATVDPTTTSKDGIIMTDEITGEEKKISWGQLVQSGASYIDANGQQKKITDVSNIQPYLKISKLMLPPQDIPMKLDDIETTISSQTGYQRRTKTNAATSKAASTNNQSTQSNKTSSKTVEVSLSTVKDYAKKYNKTEAEIKAMLEDNAKADGKTVIYK